MDHLMAGLPASELEVSEGDDSYVLWAPPPPDFYQPGIRELMTYDAICEASCPFIRRNGTSEFIRKEIPSPLYWSRQIEWPWAVFNARLEPHHTVLDAGSGWSVLKFALAARCRHVTCMDHDQESLNRAGQTISTLRVGNITQELGDLRSIPYPDGSFDRVVCISVLEHLPDGHEQAVREMKRVLRPGGRLLVTMDVVTSKVLSRDYHLNPESTVRIVNAMGIRNRFTAPVAMAGRDPETGFQFSVLLCLWVKPEGVNKPCK